MEQSATHYIVTLLTKTRERDIIQWRICLLYTSEAADDLLCVDLGGRRIIKKKTFFRRQHLDVFYIVAIVRCASAKAHDRYLRRVRDSYVLLTAF